MPPAAPPPTSFRRPGGRVAPGLLRLAVAAGALLAAGCGSLDPFQPPRMVFSMLPGDSPPTPALIAARTMRHELQGTTIAATAIGPHAVNDNNYVVPDHAWLAESFLPYFVHLKTSLGLRHVNEGFDCDNFAALLKQQLVLANRRTGFVSGGDVPCATMKVRQVEAFGSVPSLGEDYHSLNLVRTSQGWYVIEPQDGLIEHLNTYPNRDHIVDLFF